MRDENIIEGKAQVGIFVRAALTVRDQRIELTEEGAWVIEHAPRDAFYARPLHPYATALKAAVPEPDPGVERLRRGTPLAGELPSVTAPPPGRVFAGRCPMVQPVCRAERPDLRAFPGGRLAACHFAES